MLLYYHVNSFDCILFISEYLSNFQKLHQDRQTNPQALVPLLPIFRRSIYIIGLMLRFFDFTDKEVYGDAYPVSIHICLYICIFLKTLFL